jgi:hypothetical protein
MDPDDPDEAPIGAPDVWALTPEAQPVAFAAATVYLRHTRRWLIGLLAHGSALKGGFISGCSDVDMQLYLRDEAFSSDGALPFELGLAIQRDLAHISLGPFEYIQCYALSPHPRDGWVGPIPGAYHMILGRMPAPEATADQLRDSARRALEEMRPAPEYISSSLLTYSHARLERQARLLCTDVWPLVFHVLSLSEPDPIAVWRLTKIDAIGRLPTETLRRKAEVFLVTVEHGFAGVRPAERLIAVLARGVALRTSVDEWYHRRTSAFA